MNEKLIHIVVKPGKQHYVRKACVVSAPGVDIPEDAHDDDSILLTAGCVFEGRQSECEIHADRLESAHSVIDVQPVSPPQELDSPQENENEDSEPEQPQENGGGSNVRDPEEKPLDEYTNNELRRIAEAHGIEFASNAVKAELVEAIQGFDGELDIATALASTDA